MSIPTVAWDETSPAGSQAISLGDNRIREMKTQIRQIINVDHDFPSSGSAADNGQHKKMTLQEQADLGTGAEGVPILGAQTVSGKAELVFTDEDDNDIQITSGGVLMAGRLANDTYFLATNAAGTGTVNLIKANASDLAVISAGAELATSAAPTTDAGIANKKYVDDQKTNVTTLQVTGTSDITSAGTSYGDMDDMELTLTGAGVYVFTFNAPIKLASNGSSTVAIALDIDGTDVVEGVYGGYSINTENPVGKINTAIHWIATITTETTAKIQWKHGTASAVQYGTESKRVFSFVKIA